MKWNYDPVIPEQPQATWRETFLEYMKASEDEVEANDWKFFYFKFRQGKKLTFCSHESNFSQA